jgi:NADH-quinone oxidoreductase subunit M
MREFVTFAPLIVLAVWMGLYPKPFLDRLATSVQHVIARVSPQYTASADCGAAPTPQLLAANTANQFLASVPCGPDGQPLAPGQPPAGDRR